MPRLRPPLRLARPNPGRGRAGAGRGGTFGGTSGGGGRTAAQKLRSTARWQKTRRAQLAAHPLCCDPFGTHRAQRRIEPATTVHHIDKVADRPDRAFDPDNLASLCPTCHDRVSALERRRRPLPASAFKPPPTPKGGG